MPWGFPVVCALYAVWFWVDCITCCLVLGVFDRFVDCWFWVDVVGWYCLFVFRRARMWLVIVLQGFVATVLGC